MFWWWSLLTTISTISSPLPLLSSSCIPSPPSPTPPSPLRALLLCHGRCTPSWRWTTPPGRRRPSAWTKRAPDMFVRCLVGSPDDEEEEDVADDDDSDDYDLWTRRAPYMPELCLISGSVLENHLKVRSILLKGISNSGGIGLPQSQAQLRVKSRGKRIWISMSKASKGREVPLNNRYCQHLLDQAVHDN